MSRWSRRNILKSAALGATGLVFGQARSARAAARRAWNDASGRSLRKYRSPKPTVCRVCPAHCAILAYRDGDEIIRNERTTHRLSDTVYPRRHLRNPKYEYHALGIKMDLVRAAMGCNYHCRFCYQYGKDTDGNYLRWQGRSPESQFKELSEIDAPLVFWVDDDMTTDMDALDKLADLLIENKIENTIRNKIPNTLEPFLESVKLESVVGLPDPLDKAVRLRGGEHPASPRGSTEPRGRFGRQSPDIPRIRRWTRREGARPVETRPFSAEMS